ncbi:hypothetical protein ACQEXU_17420 [Vibrio sp. TRT 21S02]
MPYVLCRKCWLGDAALGDEHKLHKQLWQLSGNQMAMHFAVE